MWLSIESNSSHQTHKIGRCFAKVLKKSWVVVLKGPLGVGKTTFIKGMVEGFGFDSRRVVSSSFILVKEYNCKKMKVYHIDAYRIRKIQELFNLGYEEYFYTPDGVTLIEWGDRVLDILESCFIVEMMFKGESKRILRFYYKL